MWLKEEWWDMLGGGTMVHMLEPEMASGVQDSQLCYFFVHHPIAHSSTVNTSPVVYWSTADS